MKLFRHGPRAAERPGVVLDDGKPLAVAAVGADHGERQRVVAWAA